MLPHATIQQLPPDHAGGHVLEVDELQVEAGDYDAALAEAEGRAPEGWRLIALCVDRAPERGTRS
ncbi:hypothetical protein [Solicola sp. PLA-1-18]|uniref:hypothetical protein n=1 Tax=Solicola sp. PLA-1-18 TaxID=3380532 RepID=UPI003B7E995E